MEWETVDLVIRFSIKKKRWQLWTGQWTFWFRKILRIFITSSGNFSVSRKTAPWTQSDNYLPQFRCDKDLHLQYDACAYFVEGERLWGGDRLFPRRWRCTQAVVGSLAAKVVEWGWLVRFCCTVAQTVIWGRDLYRKYLTTYTSSKLPHYSFLHTHGK